MLKLLTLDDYLAPHVEKYGHLLSVDDRRRGQITVDCANELLTRAHVGGMVLNLYPKTGTHSTSGWRPADYNETVRNAKPRSLHITLQAIDIYDPDGDLDEWLIGDGQQTLIEIGLWLEHPASTKGWSHVQTVPPKSGRRVFFP